MNTETNIEEIVTAVVRKEFRWWQENMDKKLSEVLRRVKQVEVALCKRPTDYAEMLCLISENTSAMSNMKSMFRDVLKDMRQEARGQYKQKVHLRRRINLSNPEPGVIPPLTEDFHRKLAVAKEYHKPEKFYYTEQIADISKFDTKKQLIMPNNFGDL